MDRGHSIQLYNLHWRNRIRSKIFTHSYKPPLLPLSLKEKEMGLRVGKFLIRDPWGCTGTLGKMSTLRKSPATEEREIMSAGERRREVK